MGVPASAGRFNARDQLRRGLAVARVNYPRAEAEGPAKRTNKC